MPSDKYCPFCGAPLRSNSYQCRYCGEMVDGPTLKSAAQHSAYPPPSGQQGFQQQPPNNNYYNPSQQYSPPPQQQQTQYKQPPPKQSPYAHNPWQQDPNNVPPVPPIPPIPPIPPSSQAPNQAPNNNQYYNSGSVFTQYSANPQQPNQQFPPTQSGMFRDIRSSVSSSITSFNQPPPVGFCPNPSWPTRNKILAGILAICLGQFGVHNFYLGEFWLGILHLAFVWTGIPAILAVVEGILILCSSDEKFMWNHKVKIFGNKPF